MHMQNAPGFSPLSSSLDRDAGELQVCRAHESCAVPSCSACTLSFIPVASSSTAAKAEFPNHPSLLAFSVPSCILS